MLLPYLILPNWVGFVRRSNGTSEFLTTFTFGQMLDSNSTYYTYNGRDGSVSEGKSGSVKFEGSGRNARVTIQVEFEDGVQVEATIQCNDVVSGLVSAPTETLGPQDGTAKLSVTLEGSEPAGTFDVTSTEDGVCGYGAESGSILVEGLEDASDAFAVEFYDEGEELTKFWLLVPKAREAASGTSNFYVEINDDQEYYLDNQDGSGQYGTGTVRIQQSGNTATVSLDAKMNNGKVIKAEVECRNVSR